MEIQVGWADFYLGNPVGEGGQVQSRNPGGRGGKKGALLVGHVEFFFSGITHSPYFQSQNFAT